MITYTEEQLLEFSNHLLRTLRVKTSKKKDSPIYQLDLSSELLEQWKYVNQDKLKPLPSAHQIEDKVWVKLWSTKFGCEIIAVHFYAGKVKYDVEVFGDNGEVTRLYNVDSAFVSKTV